MQKMKLLFGLFFCLQISTGIFAQVYKPLDFLEAMTGPLSGEVAEIRYSSTCVSGEQILARAGQQKAGVVDLIWGPESGDYVIAFNEEGEVKNMQAKILGGSLSIPFSDAPAVGFEANFEFRNTANYKVVEIKYGKYRDEIYYDSLVIQEDYKETWRKGDQGFGAKEVFFQKEVIDEKNNLLEKRWVKAPIMSIARFKKKMVKGKLGMRQVLLERNQAGEVIRKEEASFVKGKRKVGELKQFDRREEGGVQIVVETNLASDTIRRTKISEEENVIFERIEDFKNRDKATGLPVLETRKITYSDRNYKTTKTYFDNPNFYVLEVENPNGKINSKSIYNNSLLLYSETMRYDQEEIQLVNYKLFDYEKGIDEVYKVFFTYDEKDNWITRTVKKNGKEVALQTREIIYR